MHASLRRQLFVAFGLAIVLSAGLGWLAFHLLAPGPAALPVGLGLTAMVLWIVAGGIAWRVTRPLVELVSVARDLGEGKLDRRMRLRPLHGSGPGHGHGPPAQRRPSEVAVLARAVNTMAERIEAEIAGQRELLAAVSHELRTPLGHMRVLIDTARAREGDEDGPILDELEREILELDELVDQLLAHSRLEFDRVEARDLDLASLAIRALERVGADASKLEIETARERLEADPTLLGRALVNLIRNAQTHGRGLVALRVREGEAGQVCFEVEDRGPGFEPGEAEAAFEAFTQGRASAGGSLGLGLSLVRRIAEAHGGECWAETREQGGARVGFCVQTEHSRREGDEASDANPTQIRGRPRW